MWATLGRLLAWVTRCERVYLSTREHPYSDPGWRTYAATSRPWRWWQRQFHDAITIGRVTVFVGEERPPERLIRHERAHYEQAVRLGWRYGPAYAWGMLVGLLRAIHAHHPMEEEARDAE